MLDAVLRRRLVFVTGKGGVGKSAVALALGLVVLLAAKGNALHRLFGAAYVSAMIVVNVTALGIYRLTGHFGPFHALALASLACVALGTIAAVRQNEGWLARHYRAMAYSYLGLWAAAAAEAVVRLKLFGGFASDARGAITVGVAIAILFALIGTLIVPRLQRAALGILAER